MERNHFNVYLCLLILSPTIATNSQLRMLFITVIYNKTQLILSVSWSKNELKIANAQATSRLKRHQCTTCLHTYTPFDNHHQQITIALIGVVNLNICIKNAPKNNKMIITKNYLQADIRGVNHTIVHHIPS